MARRKPTATSNFGVSRRESHDSTPFYERFTPPEISTDEAIKRNPPDVLDQVFRGDSRNMTRVETSSVALVVTSPPYFAGKAYEEALGEGHIPEDYLAYLQMLEDVFAECKRVLEPGGRIAVNVANLGRKPYRSLSADVIQIFERLGLLIRGEIIWQKAEGASGNCAWGSFQSAANPVLRDLTERIVIASKGRFDRALSRPKRARENPPLPSTITISRDEFMELTTDVWTFPPESATRIGHPAPFPVELPERLIQLFTYEDDVVLDPFIGSGTTAVAAVLNDRHFIGYDTEEEYRELAMDRVEQARVEHARTRKERDHLRVEIPVIPLPDTESDSQARAVREGARARELAERVLEGCGFTIVARDRRFRSGVEVNFEVKNKYNQRLYVDVSGAFTSVRAGLKRTDTIWKALGKAAVLQSEPTAARTKRVPYLLLTTDLPARSSAGFRALKTTRGGVILDAVNMLDPAGQDRLMEYATAKKLSEPIGEFPARST